MLCTFKTSEFGMLDEVFALPLGLLSTFPINLATNVFLPSRIHLLDFLDIHILQFQYLH